MPTVSAKCTQCGANIEVDSTKEAAICRCCGEAFVIEKAVNLYQVTLITSSEEHATIQNLVNMADQAEKLGDIVKARECIDRAINIDASHPVLVNYLNNRKYRYFGTIRVTEDDYNEVKAVLSYHGSIQATEKLRQVTRYTTMRHNSNKTWTHTELDLKTAFYIVKNFETLNFYFPQEITEEMAQSSLKNKSGCYIATSIYGSYDCPEVWTLRRFRDSILANNWHGRLFVRCYYAISPVLVRLFGNQIWFRRICKPLLNHIVYILNTRGIENTPYIDQIWR